MSNGQTAESLEPHDLAVGMDQYLTFIMADEEYGVDILRVQEIKGWDSVTPLPNTPPYVKGVINLRGTIVHIVPVLSFSRNITKSASELTEKSEEMLMLLPRLSLQNV